MSSGVNKVVLIGNLGQDAAVRYTSGGTAMARFSIACSEMWTDKNGDRKEQTEWVNCVLWGKQAESLTEHLRKGKQVYIEGKLQTREYTDTNGVKRRPTEVRVERVTLLGGLGGPKRRFEGQDEGYGHSAEPETDGDEQTEN